MDIFIGKSMGNLIKTSQSIQQELQLTEIRLILKTAADNLVDPLLVILAQSVRVTGNWPE